MRETTKLVFHPKYPTKARVVHKETICVKSVACNKFHANNFLLSNTHEKLRLFSLRHVIRQGECVVSVVMVASMKKEKTILRTLSQHREFIALCKHTAKELNVDKEKVWPFCVMSQSRFRTS
jgi:hypothetical protein